VDIVLKLIKKLFSLFLKSPQRTEIPSSTNSIKENKRELITLIDHLTSSGKYPDRMNSPECTDEVKDSAKSLINQVNQLLNELNVEKCKVSSGFRTQEANDTTANAAKKSRHMTGNALDIEDLDGSLKKLITLDLLAKYSLYCEDFEHTKTWLHLQDIPPKSGRRIFIP